MPRIGQAGSTGGLFIAIGAAFAGTSLLSYPTGTLTRMGPGFFPLLIAGALVCVGIAVLLDSSAPQVVDDERVSIEFRPLAIIVGAVVAFGILLEPVGLYLCTIASVLLASLADPRLTLRSALVLAIALAAAAHLAFVVGLGLQVPLAPDFGAF